MAFEVGLAETEAQREAVYRFRYSVYVEEMGRYEPIVKAARIKVE